jgi:tetratricopeptide (TPR) repeat protein
LLDNLESLLTASGGWRDERWKLLVEALSGHRGLSRVVLTSRIPPVDLPPAVQIVAIHSLPLNEAALLIRELPNLRRLLDGKAPEIGLTAGRHLLRELLRLVQGHPKLIELADRLARDPQGLAAQTSRATDSIMPGTSSLDTFFETGETSLDADAFFKSIRAWVTGIAETLSEAARSFFYFVCALEESDRESTVVFATWTDVWERLGKSAPTPEVIAIVERLVSVGFVEKQAQKDASGAEGTAFTLGIHPAVADAGRADAGVAFQAIIDAAMADHWSSLIAQGLESYGQNSAAAQQIARAGLSGSQYLSRLGKWWEAGRMVEHVYLVDDTPRTVAGLLPMMHRIVQETAGTPWEHFNECRLAHLLLFAGKMDEAESLLRKIVERPDEHVPSVVMNASWTDLATLLAETGRFEEALRATKQRIKYARACGPWELLGTKVQQLKVMSSMDNYKKVLKRAPRLVEQVNAAPAPKFRELPIVSDVVEGLFEVVSIAAARMGEIIVQENAQGETRIVISDSQRARANQAWQQAIDYNAERLRSMERRGASLLHLARVRFNDYGHLLFMGRLPEARALLGQCRIVFERHSSVRDLGCLFSAFSTLERHSQNVAQARIFEETALRYKYVDNDFSEVWVSHFNLATRIFEGDGNLGQALAHRVAALLLAMASGSERARYYTTVLARDIQRNGAAGRAALPASFTDLCATLKLVSGVKFEEMMSELALGLGDQILQRAYSGALGS